jgi:prenyltransferase beta subunit
VKETMPRAKIRAIVLFLMIVILSPLFLWFSLPAPPSRKEALLSCLSKTQLLDGSACATPGELFVHAGTTYFLISASRTLEASDTLDVDNAVKWIAVRQAGDGSFDHVLWSTYYSVMALKAIGSLQFIDADSVVRWLVNLPENSTFLSNRITDIYESIMILNGTGSLSKIDSEKVTFHLLQFYDADDGSFHDELSHEPYFESTEQAVSILHVLDALNTINVNKTAEFIVSIHEKVLSDEIRFILPIPLLFTTNALHVLGRLDMINLERTIDFIKKSQTGDGTFSNRPYGPHDPVFTSLEIDWSYVCTLSLLNALDILDEPLYICNSFVQAYDSWLRSRNVTIIALIILSSVTMVFVSYGRIREFLTKRRKKA